MFFPMSLIKRWYFAKILNFWTSQTFGPNMTSVQKMTKPFIWTKNYENASNYYDCIRCYKMFIGFPY